MAGRPGSPGRPAFLPRPSAVAGRFLPLPFARVVLAPCCLPRGHGLNNILGGTGFLEPIGTYEKPSSLVGVVEEVKVAGGHRSIMQRRHAASYTLSRDDPAEGTPFCFQRDAFLHALTWGGHFDGWPAVAKQAQRTMTAGPPGRPHNQQTSNRDMTATLAHPPWQSSKPPSCKIVAAMHALAYEDGFSHRNHQGLNHRRPTTLQLFTQCLDNDNDSLGRHSIARMVLAELGQSTGRPTTPIFSTTSTSKSPTRELSRSPSPLVLRVMLPFANSSARSTSSCQTTPTPPRSIFQVSWTSGNCTVALSLACLATNGLVLGRQP